MRDDLDSQLFPRGTPKSEAERALTFELYKLMVQSSEGLVARRQGVNTFFLTISGALLTAIGLIVGRGDVPRLQALGVLVLAITGMVLSFAWVSLIKSFGQLNTGKFKVINRLEQEFPAAIYLAEWHALGKGKEPKRYRTFTSREVWTPWAFATVYAIASVVALGVSAGWWELG